MKRLTLSIVDGDVLRCQLAPFSIGSCSRAMLSAAQDKDRVAAVMPTARALRIHAS